MLAKDKPVGDSDDDNDDYDYSDDDDDDDQKEEDIILIQKIKREPGVLTSLTPATMIMTKTPPRQKTKMLPPQTKMPRHMTKDQDTWQGQDDDHNNDDHWQGHRQGSKGKG